MAEVVEALEGSIAPIECISLGADGQVVCSRESDPGHVCPTKLLWTRVHGSIVSTLTQTTLADLLVAPPGAVAPLAGVAEAVKPEPMTTGA
jgi:DNA-binding IscR family transcriptional regulator